MKKLVSVLLTLAVAVSLLVVPAVVSADGTPTIDGVIEVDEWGEPFGTYELTHGTAFTASLYITNNDEYLYVAAQYVDGDFSGPQSMGLANGLNIHIDADNSDGMPDNSDITIIVSDDGLCIPCDPPEQGWDCGDYYTYSASGAGVLMDWNGDADSGNGQVEVAVPLSLIDVALGDTIGLLFQPFSNVKVPPSSPDAACPDWPSTYTDFTLEANTAVGLTADVPDIVAINVDPTSIDFGTLKPGQTSSVEQVTVTNIGTHTVDVDAYLTGWSSDLFKDNLMLKNPPKDWSDWGVGTPWSKIVEGLAMDKSDEVKARLSVPLTYTPSNVETGKLIFEATGV